jgi:erythromycin esterase-like protein
MPICRRFSAFPLFGALILLIASNHACAQTEAISSGDGIALKAVTHSLCKAQVAMVGEIASHGDGHTLAFKVALVEQLVNQCGFNAVFFEANQDEFIRLNERLRSNDAVTPDDFLTAQGSGPA